MSSSDHKTLGIGLVPLGPDVVATALSRSRLTHVWLVEGTGKATSPKLKFSSELISEGTRTGHNTIISPHICEGSLMNNGEGTTESIPAEEGNCGGREPETFFLFSGVNSMCFFM